MGQGKSRAARTTQGEEEDELAKRLVRPESHQFALHDLKLVEIPLQILQWVELERLNLDVNFIHAIPSSISALARLTELTLSSNRISSLLDENAEAGDNELGEGRGIFALTSLRKLNLSLNCIERMPEDLTRLVNLTDLNLSGNRLKSLPPLRGMTELKVLVLNVNELTSLPPLPCSLVALCVARNNLRYFELVEDEGNEGESKSKGGEERMKEDSEIPATSEEGKTDDQRTKDRECVGKQNEATKNGKKTKKSKKSRRDKAKEDSGEKAEKNEGSGGVESWYGRLQELDLSENKLTEFPLVLLSLTALTSLQLSCNYLTSFPPGFSRAWPKLNNLRVAFNDLPDLPAEVLQMPELKRLDFRGNPFQLDRQIEVLEQQRTEKEEERKRRAEEAEKERKRKEEEEAQNKGKKNKKGKKGKKDDDKTAKTKEDGGDQKGDEEQQISSKSLKLALENVPQRAEEKESEDEAKDDGNEEEGDENKPNWLIISSEFTKKDDWDYNSVDRIMLPDEILPGLYLGSWVGAINKHLLKHLGVTHILTVASQLTPAFPELFTYKHVEIEDLHTENVMEHFEPCIEFIDQARQTQANVLVHCRAGVSRSASVVIAYVMVRERMSWDAAMAYVRERRPMVCPNMGFQTQLQRWDQLYNKSSSSSSGGGAVVVDGS